MNKENIKNWLKVNLFSNWYNSIISLFVLFVFFSIIPSFIDWAIIKATFIGKTKADCKTGGACWVFISVWFEKFIMDSIQTKNCGIGNFTISNFFFRS